MPLASEMRREKSLGRLLQNTKDPKAKGEVKKDRGQ